MGRLFEIRFDLIIGFTLSALGLFSFFGNAYSIFVLQDPASRTLISFVSFTALILLALPMLAVTILSIRHHYPFRELSRGLQVLILLFFSGLSILDSFESSYGIALFYLAVILAYNYKQLNHLRFALLALFIISFTIIGAGRADRLHGSVLSILFDLFFLLTIAMAQHESLRKMRQRNNTLQMIVKDLKKELTDMEPIESKITALQLDVDEFSLTPAEREILFIMCDKGLTSNKDLADHLNKSISTIKSQIHSIFEKTGIHKRSSLIAFFKE